MGRIIRFLEAIVSIDFFNSRKLQIIERIVRSISERQEHTMSELDDLKSAVADQNATVAGLATAMDGATSRIQEDVTELLRRIQDGEDPADLQELTDSVTANTTAVKDAASRLAAIDPVSDFPAPPADGTPGDSNPTDPTGTTTGDGSVPPLGGSNA